MPAENPNTTTLQTGLGRPSRRTGNRIDRLAERTWWLRQQIVFPMGAVPCALSVGRTYYTRALVLGALYLMAHHRIVEPGAAIAMIVAYLVWELVIGAYLFLTVPKFDLVIRVFIAVVAIALVYGHLFEGVCHAL